MIFDYLGTTLLQQNNRKQKTEQRKTENRTTENGKQNNGKRKTENRTTENGNRILRIDTATRTSINSINKFIN